MEALAAHSKSTTSFDADEISGCSWLDIAVHKNWESHIDASHSRQPLVKGERLVRYEVNAVIASLVQNIFVQTPIFYLQCCLVHLIVLQTPTSHLRLLWPPTVSVSWCCCSLKNRLGCCARWDNLFYFCQNFSQLFKAIRSRHQ